MTPKEKVHQLFSRAGVTIDGPRPFDVRIHDERVFGRILSGGTLAAGESYMEGLWDCTAIDELVARLLAARVDRSFQFDLEALTYIIASRFKNLQSKKRASQVADAHYDKHDPIIRGFVGKPVVYTCGYWKDARTLPEAQIAKLDLVCRKIGLKPGDHILDIGCGYGAFAKYAAEKYGASVVGTTISSKGQIAFAKEHTRGLPVEIRSEDYRDTKGKFDHIVSIGMFEAVGPKNFRTYFEKAAELLKDDGIFLLHTIGGPRSVNTTDPWIHKYIFPNGVLPSESQIRRAVDGVFAIKDWHRFGKDYDKTLMAWMKNLDGRASSIKQMYGDTDYRMWRYYLLSCAGSFRAGLNDLWQIALVKPGNHSAYTPVR